MDRAPYKSVNEGVGALQVFPHLAIGKITHVLFTVTLRLNALESGFSKHCHFHFYFQAELTK